jgi:hypothetical protein
MTSEDDPFHDLDDEDIAGKFVVVRICFIFKA